MNLTKAMKIAIEAHEGQVRKGSSGDAYVMHPLRVMVKLSSLGCSEEILQAAALHDVVEDTQVCLVDLEMMGASSRVVELVELLTRRPEELYEDFVERIAQDPDATTIKVADIEDNLRDLSCVPDSDSLRSRYEKALSRLTKGNHEIQA